MRQGETETKEPALPVCALRPLQPRIAKKRSSSEEKDGLDNAEDEYAYVHHLYGQPEWQIQCNRCATSAWQEHTITWSYLDDVKPHSDAGKVLEDGGRGRATGDGSFVRNLRMGDVITVWGKARFPGWVNNIEYVKVEVYWAL